MPIPDEDSTEAEWSTYLDEKWEYRDMDTDRDLDGDEEGEGR